MLIPVFPVTGVSAALSGIMLILATREEPGPSRRISIVFASVLVAAAIGITLVSLAVGSVELEMTVGRR